MKYRFVQKLVNLEGQDMYFSINLVPIQEEGRKCTTVL